MSLIIGFANCNLIRREKRVPSCFLEIQIFQFESKTVKYLSTFLRRNSLQRNPNTLTIGRRYFQKNFNEDEKFYINCKSVCNSHVFVEPPTSDEYLVTSMKLLHYESLLLITNNCLRRFETFDFTTTYILIRNLGCRTQQSRKFSKAYATLFRAFPDNGGFLFMIYPFSRGLKAHSFHKQLEIIGPNRELEKEENSDADTDLTIAEIVMDSMNISMKNAISNIYTKFMGRLRFHRDHDVLFKVKFFSRIIQEQIVYCPKHKNYQETNHLSLLFLFEPFQTCVSIAIFIILVTSALYLNITAGKRPSSVWKQIEMFIDRLLIVFQAFMGQDTVTKTKSILLVLLGIAAIMLPSTYKYLITVRLVTPDNILEPSFKNLSVLKDHNYHILCSHSLSKMYYADLGKLSEGDIFLDRDQRLFCLNDCLLSKFILSNLLREYENSSFQNVGFYVKGKGDMNNGKNFEIKTFIRRKTNCNSLENALSYDYSYIVYNNLRYVEAIFKTRVLQEAGVTNFIERMDIYNKYEIYNWNSIKRRPNDTHPKYSGVFRLAHKHIRPFAILLFSMLSLDFIAFLIEVYTFSKNFVNKAFFIIVDGCFRIYSYVFAFKIMTTSW